MGADITFPPFAFAESSDGAGGRPGVALLMSFSGCDNEEGLISLRGIGLVAEVISESPLTGMLCDTGICGGELKPSVKAGLIS